MAQSWQVPHGWMLGKIFRIKADLKGIEHVPYKGGYIEKTCPFKAGDSVKVVMVSRLGDCGITRDLEHPMDGMIYYRARVCPSALEEIEGQDYSKELSVPEHYRNIDGSEPVKQLPLISFQEPS